MAPPLEQYPVFRPFGPPEHCWKVVCESIRVCVPEVREASMAAKARHELRRDLRCGRARVERDNGDRHGSCRRGRGRPSRRQLARQLPGQRDSELRSISQQPSECLAAELEEFAVATRADRGGSSSLAQQGELANDVTSLHLADDDARLGDHLESARPDEVGAATRIACTKQPLPGAQLDRDGLRGQLIPQVGGHAVEHPHVTEGSPPRSQPGMLRSRPGVTSAPRFPPAPGPSCRALL